MVEEVEDTMNPTNDDDTVRTFSANGSTTRKMTKAEKALVKRMDSVEELMSYFNARLRGYDPGVSAFVGDRNDLIQFDGESWQWLEPLLIELRERRNV